MEYSLINIIKEKDGFVNGIWLQNHIGSIETATKEARKTEIANNNRIKVAVVEDLNYCCPTYNLRKGLKRLDKPN